MVELVLGDDEAVAVDADAEVEEGDRDRAIVDRTDLLAYQKRRRGDTTTRISILHVLTSSNKRT
jgi:hypothetical protein